MALAEFKCGHSPSVRNGGMVTKKKIMVKKKYIPAKKVTSPNSTSSSTLVSTKINLNNLNDSIASEINKEIGTRRNGNSNILRETILKIKLKREYEEEIKESKEQIQILKYQVQELEKKLSRAMKIGYKDTSKNGDNDLSLYAYHHLLQTPFTRKDQTEELSEDKNIISVSSALTTPATPINTDSTSDRDTINESYPHLSLNRLLEERETGDDIEEDENDKENQCMPIARPQEISFGRRILEERINASLDNPGNSQIINVNASSFYDPAYLSTIENNVQSPMTSPVSTEENSSIDENAELNRYNVSVVSEDGRRGHRQSHFRNTRENYRPSQNIEKQRRVREHFRGKKNGRVKSYYESRFLI